MRRLLMISWFSAVSMGLAACTSEGRADGGSGNVRQLWHDPVLGATPAAVNLPQGSLAPLIKGLKPAVVNISSTTRVKNPHRFLMPRGRTPRGEGGERDPWQEFFERYFGSTPRELPDELRGQSLGSGFIINSDGHILTNNHVIKEATDIRVRLSDNRQYKAKVVGSDELLDVALLQLQGAPKNLPTVVLGDSDALEQGDFTLAMGSPFDLRESASFGIVSAKDRQAVTGGPYDDFIQTDAAINPGNSGGPLFNLKGEVVGINTAIVSPQIGQGIGFAVPINLAKQILPQLESKGKVARGYLGVTVGDMNPDLAQGFGLPPETQGAVVQQVLPKSPAAKAGVQAGDVVVALNGRPVESNGQLTRGVAVIPPGSKVTLNLLRGGKKQEVAVTLAQRPSEEQLARGGGEGGAESEGEGQSQPEERPRDVKLGVRLSEVTPEMSRELGLQSDSGVVIADVTPDSPAERAGLQRGDLIVEVNRQPVAKPDQIVKIVNKAKPGDVVLLRVRRGQSAVFIPVRIEPKS